MIPEKVKGHLRLLQVKRTNKEDNSFKPVVTKDESKDEENNTKDDSDTSNNVDEMFNFLEILSLERSFGVKCQLT